MAHFITETQQRSFRSDMRDILLSRGFQKLDLPHVNEEVYGKRVDRDGEPLTLRVFTTVEESSGMPRTNGSDAIRVALFGKDEDGDAKLVGADTRVHRTRNWESNLRDRLENATETLIGPKCSHGHRMVLRSGSNGKFWGCSEFPRCNDTKPYNG